MKTGLTFSYIYILVFIFLQFISLLAKDLNSKKIFTVELILLDLSLAIIAAHIYPSDVWDLSRHLANVQMAQSSLYGSYVEKVSSDGLYLYEAIVLLAAKVNMPHLLPFIIVLITFLALSGIILVMYNYTSRIQLLVFLLLYPALSGIENIFSGLRTTCAYTIIIFAMINFIYNKKSSFTLKFFVIIVCFVISLGLHPSVWTLVIITILFFTKLRVKLICPLLVLWSLFSQTIGNILISLPMPLAYIGQKLVLYIGKSIMDTRLLYITFTFIIFTVLQLVFIYKNKGNLSRNDGQYLRYLSFVLAFAIGSFTMPELLNRSIIMLSPLMLPLIMIEREVFSTRVYILILSVDLLYAFILLYYAYYTFSLYAIIA